MSGSDNLNQMTFDFDDFAPADGKSSGEPKPDRKRLDDLTPGLFDPVVSEEEEMQEFQRELHARGNSDETPETPAGIEPDCPVYQNRKVVSESSSPVSGETSVPVAGTVPVEGRPSTLTRKQLKRAALLFLASLHPSGLASEVPLRGDRCRTAAAACWLQAGKTVQTAVAEIRTAAEAAIESSRGAEQLNMLKLARMEREMIEQKIRRSEPRLKDGCSLFPDYEHWDYSSSANPAYHECLTRISRLEYAIYHGSRIERIQSAETASLLYLVVPENTMDPSVLADGWGLVFVRDDLSCSLVKEARRMDIPEAKQTRLALNIAAAALPDVLFAGGIHSVSGPSGLVCGPLPRRRRGRRESS